MLLFSVNYVFTEADFWNSAEVGIFFGISFNFLGNLRNSMCKIPRNSGVKYMEFQKKYQNYCTLEPWRHGDIET
jgi:hypothetical protein